MTAQVLIDLFSGRPNPNWLLDDAAASHFQALLNALPIVPLVKHDDSDPLRRPSGGYRGLRVVFGEPAGRHPVILYGGLVLDVAANVLRREALAPSVAERLYATAPAIIQSQLGGLPLATLAENGAANPITGITGELGALKCTQFPTYHGNTGDWHTFIDSNNCYNYANDALNKANFGVALPGPKEPTDFTAKSLRKALAEDLLEFKGTSLPGTCPDGGLGLIAVALRNHPSGAFGDFHCVRLDDAGRWSHKDGIGSVTNHDNNGQRMDDIKQARFFWNPQLLGFFWTTTDKAKIK
jgi:hypothetical protein